VSATSNAYPLRQPSLAVAKALASFGWQASEGCPLKP
jgi:hypothetical protein